MRFRVAIGVLAGTFASQQLAYAHLLDVAPGADLEQVEVLGRDRARRLAHFFEAGSGPGAVPEDTLVLLLPGAGVPLEPTGRLRVVGRFPGRVTRALMDES